jgi:hypothetical protein
MHAWYSYHLPTVPHLLLQASFDFTQDKEGALHAVSLLGMLCKTVLPSMLGSLPAAALAAGALPANFSEDVSGV